MDNANGKVPAYLHGDDPLEASVMSYTECTGMVAAPAADADQAEAFRHIYDIPVEENEDMVDHE